jgi:hypothetical protein
MKQIAILGLASAATLYGLAFPALGGDLPQGVPYP